MMKKWSNFCNIWNLLANLEKIFSGKYVEVYILVLILWKTHKGAHSNHIRQKKFKKTLQKWWKLSNFHNIWNIKAYFGKTFSLKYIKVYMIRKTILSAFHCFLFHKNIPITFDVIALLLKINIIFGNYLVIFAPFSPDIQPNVTFFNRNYCYWF